MIITFFNSDDDHNKNDNDNNNNNNNHIIITNPVWDYLVNFPALCPGNLYY